jgi:hypothetical protein
MPGSHFSSTAKSDPLSSPESFAPAKAEERIAAGNHGAANLPIILGDGPSIGSYLPTGNQKIPLGAGSVVAAGGDPQYLPVPIVTLPPGNPSAPPMPPTPNIPQPAPIQYANAFTSAHPAAGYAYGPMPAPMPMQMAAQGYPMQSMPVHPAIAYANSDMMYANPAMDRPGLPLGGPITMQQSITVLCSSIYPTQRELAVDQLSTCDCHANPQIVPLLLTTAKEDPAAMVRAAAVRGLARLGVASEAAIATYHHCKSDVDPRVRVEAEQALGRVMPAVHSGQ